MRKNMLTLSLLLLSFSVLSQSKDELNIELQNSKKIIVNLEKEVKALKKKSERLETAQINSDSENEELKGLLTVTTNRWLKPVFIDKYMKTGYFENTELANSEEDFDEIIKIFHQYDLIIRSVKVTANSEDTIRLAQKALNFNENYLRLFEIRRDVLAEKFTKENVELALVKMESLPALEKNSNLQKTKEDFRALLLNYEDSTCSLKENLFHLIQADQTTVTTKKMYNDFLTQKKYASYPYLVGVINKLQKNVIMYTPEDLSCPEEKLEIAMPEKGVPSETIKPTHSIEPKSKLESAKISVKDSETFDEKVSKKDGDKKIVLEKKEKLKEL